MVPTWHTFGEAYSAFRLYTLSPSTTPYSPQRYLHQTRRHATNGWTTCLPVSMRGKVVPVQGPTTAQCAGTGYTVVCAVPRRVQGDSHPTPPGSAILGEKPHAEFMWHQDGHPRPSLTLWDILATNFERRRTLLGHWQRISGNGGEDDGHFDRGRVEGCVTVSPQNCRAGRREGSGLWLATRARE